jgi:hypothetical protein
MSIGLAVLMVLPTPLCLHAKRKGVASAQRSGLSSEKDGGFGGLSLGTRTPHAYIHTQQHKRVRGCGSERGRVLSRSAFPHP